MNTGHLILAWYCRTCRIMNAGKCRECGATNPNILKLIRRAKGRAQDACIHCGTTRQYVFEHEMDMRCNIAPKRRHVWPEKSQSLT